MDADLRPHLAEVEELYNHDNQASPRGGVGEWGPTSTILYGLRPSSHMPDSGHLAEVEELYNHDTQASPGGGWASVA